jgi:hypothetical protein
VGFGSNGASAFIGTAVSRKDDLDNHSNQLNPNNDAYYSSRSGSGGGDDDDDFGAVVRAYYRPPAPPQVYSLQREFEFTVVTLNGKACVAKVLISDTSRLNKDLSTRLEDRALDLHKQLCDGVNRSTGVPVAYARLSTGRHTVEERAPWEPFMPAGWSKHWARVDRKQWTRMGRTRAYRQQAIEARLVVDKAAAQVEMELNRMAGPAVAVRARALADMAAVFKRFSKTPIFKVKAFWTAAAERARAIDAHEVVQAAVDALPGFDHALRTVDVLVRASNARSPESMRHPASFGYGMPESDAYGDYFGGSACSSRLAELDIWFGKGERRLRALQSALASGQPKARYDFGSYDITMDPDFHISKAAVERALQPANRRWSCE